MMNPSGTKFSADKKSANRISEPGQRLRESSGKKSIVTQHEMNTRVLISP